MSSSTTTSARPAVASRSVIWCSSLSVATETFTAPPERSASRAPSTAYPAGSSPTSQTSSRRPASSTTATVSHTPPGVPVGSDAANPQYTRMSATAVLLKNWSCCQGLMVPGQGSVAPVHDGRDFADHRPPAQARGLGADLLCLATCHECAETALGHGPQHLVEIVQGGTGCQGVHHGVDVQGVAHVTGQLPGPYDQRGVPDLVAAAQVVDHQVEFVLVLREGDHAGGADSVA